jgi:four helix bundle protein
MISQSFEDVIAWKKAHAFVLSVYKITKGFPDDEKFGLTAQFRRAAVSIEANIAEGYRKIGKQDKLRFFNISQGSLSECKDYIILARDLEYINMEQYQELWQSSEEASRLLISYCNGIINNTGIKD